eukprot:m.1044761 g.1044761  ORF g.1044761 m.1044761 type:complete len:60 (+) comp24170_c0_seq26:2263-2442(+)
MPMTVTMEITIPISNLMTWQQPTYVVQDLLLFETELPAQNMQTSMLVDRSRVVPYDYSV